MNIKTKTGIGVTGFGILYAIAALLMQRASIGNPIAPLIFPVILGVGLAILGTIYTMRESKAWKKEVKENGVKKVDSATEELNKKTNKLIILTSISGVGYAFLFEHLGYVISTSLFMGIIMFAINGKAKWKLNLGVALIFSIAVYILFSSLLSIPLPMMPILEI